jgi:hypothetical protein
MTKSTHTIGDLGGRSNPITKATPEGAGLKVTEDPEGNPFSIIIFSEFFYDFLMTFHAKGSFPPFHQNDSKGDSSIYVLWFSLEENIGFHDEVYYVEMNVEYWLE